MKTERQRIKQERKRTRKNMENWLRNERKEKEKT
jgi:hypothetical protein